MAKHVFPGLDLYYTDPPKYFTMTGQGLEYLDHDLYDMWALGTKQSLYRV